MVKIVASVEFFGENFSPAKAEQMTGIAFNNKKEVGELGNSGKYKNKPLPYGSSSLIAPGNIFDRERILWLTHTLNDKMDLIRNCGAEDIHFMISYFHTGQCNCELSQKEIKEISKLNIPFCFSTYEVDNIETIEN